MTIDLQHVAALKATASFNSAPDRALIALLERAERCAHEPGFVLHEQGATPDAFYMVLQGEVHFFRQGKHGTKTRVGAAMPGDCFGELEILSGHPRPSSAITRDWTVLYRVSSAHLREVVRGSRALSRVLQDVLPAPAPAPADPAPPAPPAPAPLPRPRAESMEWGSVWPSQGAEVVRLEGAGIHGATLATLNDLLAQALVASFRDRVLVAAIAGPADHAEETPVPGADGVHRQRLASLGWQGALAAHAAHYDYILLDPTQPAEVAAELAAPLTRVALTRPEGPMPAGHGRMVRTVLVHEEHRKHKGRIRRGVDLLAAVGSDEGGEITLEIPEDLSHLDEYRLALDLGALERLRASHGGRVPLDALSNEPGEPDGMGLSLRERVLAWARCVSNRQLGLALGGGGALGFAHVELIRQMRRAGLPIDLVSGSSFGAVVGAYHCAKPNGGLEALLGSLSRLGLAINMAPLSSAIGGAYIAHALDYARIEDLPVRFFPVATNICTGQREVIARGPVGFGVRASGAFPGIFTPATMPGKRYVDGGIADNVPADVLSARGADLVVASNVIPLPPVRAAGKPFFPGRVGRLFFEFDLLDRTIDAMRSPFVVFHKAGELQALTTAKVVFKSQSSLTQYFFWDLDSAQQVMAEAAQAIEQGRVIERIQRAWADLCIPAHERRSAG